MSSKSRSGFTLVEILTVIAIVVIISGIAVPAVMRAYSYAQASTLKLEVDALGNAFEQYRNKYGDYPPDGSNWTVFRRHCLKAFPNILASELALLEPMNSASVQGGSIASVRNDSDSVLIDNEARVMEPWEAVVFFLGGFSDSPTQPFTGPGGPFATSTATGQPYQYNISRQNAFFEFKANKLTVEVIMAASPAGPVPVTISNDEWQFDVNKLSGGDPTMHNTTHALDLLPGYVSRGLGAPFVYFDGRSYSQVKSDGSSSYLYFNYAYSPKFGAARPYKSDTALTSGVALTGVGGSQDHAYQYMNPTSFQLLCAGLDNLYGGDDNTTHGGLVTSAANIPTLFRFPSGDSDVGATGLKYFRLPTIIGAKASSQDDNSANFSEIYLSAGSNN